jgi:hypothetical protein
MKNPDGTEQDICTICGVDHMWAWADLSHGNIHLIIHAQERSDWMAERGSPVNGDMIARQRAGILPMGFLFSTADPEEIDWSRVREQARNPEELNP